MARTFIEALNSITFSDIKFNTIKQFVNTNDIAQNKSLDELLFNYTDVVKPFTYPGIMLNPNKYTFVNGKAGVGKSRWIKFFTEQHKRDVCVVASTGVAAHSVKGVTIHSKFKLPPTAEFKTLNAQKLYYKKSKYTVNLDYAKILIIDEAYTMSGALFQMVLFALDIVPNNIKKIIFVGDIKQLPSVSTPFHITHKILFEGCSSHYDLIDVINFDPQFIPRMTPEYTDILETFRSENVNVIEMRQTINYLMDHFTSKTKHVGEFVVTCCYRNIDAHNINISNTEFVTADTYHDRYIYYMNKGCPIIITKNIDVEKGLYNGAFFKLKRWTLNHILKTDTKSYEINTTPTDECRYHLHRSYNDKLWDKNEQYSMVCEFINSDMITLTATGIIEFVPAYAMTIHKTQGLTLPKLNILLRDKDYNADNIKSLLYVALSRVRDPKDIYIEYL